LHDAGIRRQATKTWKASTDPDFVAKIHLVLDLYDHPRRTLTTKPDHNRIRQGPIPSDAPSGASPDERPYPTAWPYFASRGSMVRVCRLHHVKRSGARQEKGDRRIDPQQWRKAALKKAGVLQHMLKRAMAPHLAAHYGHGHGIVHGPS